MSYMDVLSSLRWIKVKRYLINHLLSRILGGWCFVFLFCRLTEQPHHRGIWTILPQCQDVNQHVPNPKQYKFQGHYQIRLDLVILFCNSICVQHKMVGDAHPSILQCLVYRKKGYRSSLGDTQPSLKLPSFYVCRTSTGPLLKHLEDPIVFLPLPTAHNTLEMDY